MVLKFSLVTREDAWISFTLRYGNRPDWYRNEEIETPQGYATDVITQEAISEIKRLNQDDAPFYLHLLTTHHTLGRLGMLLPRKRRM